MTRWAAVIAAVVVRVWTMSGQRFLGLMVSPGEMCDGKWKMEVMDIMLMRTMVIVAFQR